MGRERLVIELGDMYIVSIIISTSVMIICYYLFRVTESEISIKYLQYVLGILNLCQIRKREYVTEPIKRSLIKYICLSCFKVITHNIAIKAAYEFVQTIHWSNRLLTYPLVCIDTQFSKSVCLYREFAEAACLVQRVLLNGLSSLNLVSFNQFVKIIQTISDLENPFELTVFL